MVKAFLAIFLLLAMGFVNAQQDPNYSQYMNNSLAINPGYAGSRDLVCVSALHQQKFVGFGENTSVFSINAPINRIKSGVGLSIVNEKYGLNKNLGFNAIYSYSLSVNDGKLGIGVSLGFINAILNPEWKGSDGSITDPDLPTTKDPTMNFDMGLGVYYRTESLYFGLSTSHVTEPKLVKTSKTMVLNRHYYLTSGYTISLSNPQFEFQPSVFIGTLGTSNAASTFDLNGLLLYNKRIWGGLSYRVSSAIVGLVGIELKNGLRIGYSYDFSTNALQSESSGTHELSMGYNFSIIKEKIPRKYKSVRFL